MQKRMPWYFDAADYVVDATGRVRVGAFPNPPHTVLSLTLVTVQTDYGDCLSIHRPIHAQHGTDTFRATIAVQRNLGDGHEIEVRDTGRGA